MFFSCLIIPMHTFALPVIYPDSICVPGQLYRETDDAFASSRLRRRVLAAIVQENVYVFPPYHRPGAGRCGTDLSGESGKCRPVLGVVDASAECDVSVVKTRRSSYRCVILHRGYHPQPTRTLLLVWAEL